MASLFSATSSRRHDLEMHNPALCEELRIRDVLENVGVMTNGTFVAAYELGGVHSHYHTEDMRNRAKESFEAVLRSMPERSMRLQLRFEIRQHQIASSLQFLQLGRLALLPFPRQLFFARRQFRLRLGQLPRPRRRLFHLAMQFA